MNSPFSNIFLDLQAYLKTLYVDPDAESPESVFKIIDMDYGQLETKERPAGPFPLILIGFQSWVFEDMAELVQSGAGDIIIKVAAAPYSSSSSITPEEYRQAALEFTELEGRVYTKLHGWRPKISAGSLAAPLGRKAATDDNRRPGLKVKVMTFGTSFEDYSAKRAYDTAPATLNLNTTFSI